MPPLLWILLALPPASVVVVILVRRSKSLGGLTPALLLSGLTGAILTSLFAFMSSTMPIAPYETSQASWTPILGGLLAALCVGFGVGALLAAAFGVPYWYISGRARAARTSVASPLGDDEQA
jgi:hypothetical protein